MDIIAAHRHGLLDQLEEEVTALAGRRGDHIQRAVVLHHLYDHSLGGHAWALAEAHRVLRTAGALTRLGHKAEGWSWSSRARQEGLEALGLLQSAIGEAERARTAAIYRAYRLSATPPLWIEAERSLPPAMLSALTLCHQARRSRTGLALEARDELAAQCKALTSAAGDQRLLDEAWAAIDSSRLRRAARRLLSSVALDRETARLMRKGSSAMEREVRHNPALPGAFRANPAQYFYALQHRLSERRRQAWREACDLDADAVALAA